MPRFKYDLAYDNSMNRFRHGNGRIARQETFRILLCYVLTDICGLSRSV